MDFSEILTQFFSHPTSSFSVYAWLIKKNIYNIYIYTVKLYLNIIVYRISMVMAISKKKMIYIIFIL